MRSTKTRGGNKGRPTRLPRTSERNCVVTDGVYSNNYFMHAATSHVGAVVKIETAQGLTYEGIFKTFSHEFDVVLELAHKVDAKDPQKLNANEVIDNLIFRAKDIVYMCAQNIQPDYAFSTSTFQTDLDISKFNGEVTGEKMLQPWEGPSTCNGEEFDLESGENSTVNGWDAQEMFNANEKFGVQTSYDDTLSDYTCPINRKDTKDFKEEEAKATRIAMEIERNPSSQIRSALENGDNEEELYAAVTRPTNDVDSTKYVPPARRSSQHHRSSGGGGGRGNYSTNGSQRSYMVPENSGRPPKNSAATLPRYHHQNSQQYHQPTYSGHPPSLRDSGNRSSPENKNGPACSAAVSQPPPQNVSTYSGSVHQQRSYPSNTMPPVAGHSQNAQQPKSQRTSPISVNTLSNGNTDYQSKSLPPVSQSPPHQFHNQKSQSSGQNAVNSQSSRGKHAQHQHNHSNNRVREDQINELKRFGSEFNLPYDLKNKDQESPKQIQVVTNRNKSPPVSQVQVSGVERNVIPVTNVPTMPQNKYSASTPATQQSMMATQTATPSVVQTQSITVPQSPVVVQAVSTTQVGLKQHPLAMPPPQPAPFPQPMHLQQRDSQVLLTQHPPHISQQQIPQTTAPPPHPQSLPPQQKVVHQMSMHQTTVLVPISQQPPATVQIQQHPSATASQQNKTVINLPVQNVTSTSIQPQQQPNVTQAGQSASANTSQGCNLSTNVHQRPPLPQQQSLKGTNSQPSTSLSPPPAELSETDSGKNKESDSAMDDVTLRVKNVRLNPDAKEYVPTVKSFTPVSRSPSTPTQSRPHTPQTPSNYSIHAANAPVATGILMPTYVVAASPSYVQPPQATSRIRKVPVNSHRTPEFHPSNIPVSAVTGQPLLAPSVTLAPSPIGHGTSYPVPAYAHHPQLAAQHYPHVQMIRMVQQGGMVPLVPSTISYHDTSGTNATAVYVNHGNGAVAMTPHAQHVHHQQQHPPPSTAPSPSQTPQGPSQSHTPNSYQHPPLAAQSAPPYPSIMCPVIQAPPTHGPPHHMVAAQAQQHAMQQYIQHAPGMPLYR